MNKEKVLIFDYDGTIVNSAREVLRAFNEVAPKYDLKKLKSMDELGKLYRKNVFMGILDRGLEKTKLKKFFSDWRMPYLKNCLKIKAFKGMKKVLNELAKNNKIIVISSNSMDVIRKSARHLGLDIGEIIGGEREISKIVKINRIKARFRGREIYYIGDTIGDMKEARKAGVRSIAVTWGFNSKKDLIKAKPDFITDKSEDLIKILH